MSELLNHVYPFWLDWNSHIFELHDFCISVKLSFQQLLSARHYVVLPAACTGQSQPGAQEKPGETSGLSSLYFLLSSIRTQNILSDLTPRNSYLSFLRLSKLSFCFACLLLPCAIVRKVLTVKCQSKCGNNFSYYSCLKDYCNLVPVKKC